LAKLNLKKYYLEKFIKFGHHESSLGWSKRKQYVRFFGLTRNFNLRHKSILDIGCGFGDFISYAEKNKINYLSYLGIDLMEEFIQIANKQNKFPKKNKFEVRNFENLKTNLNFDFIFASGIFGHRIYKSNKENYDYIERIISKAFNLCNIGVSFDFISDKVEFRTSSKDFHASPIKILELAYKYSKNVVIDNTIMPFEFVISIKKDQKFKIEKTVFESFLKENASKYRQGKL
jgi:SAM-dependent methyltransferase